MRIDGVSGLSLVAVFVGAGCVSGPVPPPASQPAPEPSPGPEFVVSRDLPPIPGFVGPMALRVVYPPEGAAIATRDSNFIFGSVGSGGATLLINGQPVPVKPNGSFLAYLPVPRDPPGAYDLLAIQGTDTVHSVHRVVIPATPVDLTPMSPAIVDSGSVSPQGRHALERWEPVRVSVRVAPNATAELHLADGTSEPLVGGPDDAARTVATEVEAVRLNSAATILVTRGADSVRLPLTRIALADSAGRRYARLGAAPPTVPDTDRVVIGRPVAGGTYKWFFLPGTQVEVTGQAGNAARIRVDRDLQVYVDPAELEMLPAGTPGVRRVANNARVVHDSAWSDLRIPISAIPPWSVDVEPRALVLTLYGTTANSDIINFPSYDPVIRHVTWRQVTSDRAEYRVELHDAPFGYLVRWERGAIVLRVRQAPAVDPDRPLSGLVIAVDAGHPPAGTTGPTGLYEAVATLAIAERLRTHLEQRGATVVMTRIAPGAVALGDRPVTARRANAHAFVSIHLNAFPDGVNPFERNGTGTYWFNPFSEPLARWVQASMVRHLGLRDLGIYYDNLAVLRPTWMPSILCEGAFLMIPEQESALRTPEFQDRYARGVAEGLVEYFRGLSMQR